MFPRASDTAAVSPAARDGKIQAWLGAIPIGIASIFLAWLGWRKWPDPLIDFGQQLYVPWRLAHGAVLYRDVNYVYGCLSVCYHAVLFHIFGASLNVLLVSNFLLLGFLLAAVYRLFLKNSDQGTATAAGLALCVPALGQFLDVGNYNYITPYSHEMFHGLVLSVVMIASLSRWLQTGQKILLALAGGCLGLVWLTKPEMFIGAAAVFFIGLIFQWRQASRSELVRSLLLAALSSLIPLGVFFVFFRAEMKMNSAEALRALAGAWLPFLHSSALQLPFYRHLMGLDAPWQHIQKAVFEFGELASLVGLGAWRLTRPTLTAWERLIFFIAAGALAINHGWPRCGHALPLLLAGAVVLWWSEWRCAATDQRRALVFPALWLGFSFFLLAKLGFNPRISHYGVFLAMPAFLSAFYLLLHLLPRCLERCGLATKDFRTFIFIFLLTGLAHLVIHSSLFYRDKDFPLGSGGDQIVTYNPAVNPTGAAMAAASDWIKSHTAPTATLAVIPEGVMLNYLTRRANPTPYVVFAFEVWAYGETNMLATYQKNPPDYVAIIHRSSAEYGLPYFGQQKGFGQDIMQWINQNYQPVWLIGNEPLQTDAFGLKILKFRKP